MPLDPSIPLQVQSPNPTTMISSFIDLGRKKLELDKSRETFDADVSKAHAQSRLAGTEADVSARTAGPRVAQAEADAGFSKFKLTGAQAQQSMQLASGLLGDPDFVAGNSDGMLEKLNQAATTMVQQFGVDPKIADATITTLKYQALHNPKAVRQALINMTQQQQGGPGQQAAALPSPVAVATDKGTQFVNAGNPALTGATPGQPQGAPLAPPNQIVTDTQGGAALGNAGTGTVQPLRPVGGATPAPQMAFPPGETRDTQATLQAERDAARQASMSAPQQRDINRNIIKLADTDLTTGKGGAAMQELASRLGFKWSGDQATDYNLLGKYLERSALTAAQGMGPHTNAGLEAQVRANGSTEYTPAAIRKIAVLNDAVTSGASLYQGGLEKAIGTNGSVFAKRQFDQQWAAAMNPADGVNGIQALRLKNAVDGKDQKELNAVLGEVGGRGSKGATALFQKLQQIRSLSGS